MNTPIPSRIALFALVSALLVSQSSLAESDESAFELSSVREFSRTIEVAGLDLASPVGAERLYRQIVDAADEICWQPLRANGVHLLNTTERTYARHCFDQAVSQALAQIQDATGHDIEALARLNRYGAADRVASR